ncbi:Transcriptional regulatory protein algP [Labilithrix luteola]|uniref:Transcriptional regulatory protein algP n=1 Tax=Labilithrix luteola TaxID=1391654 RepID=A0A0K1PL57_9BACT|nr:hypothetical protein [Labilithrix luteola]AKU94263.1 Transcriptional regulatory protein algP [Labilithrix luteola]
MMPTQSAEFEPVAPVQHVMPAQHMPVQTRPVAPMYTPSHPFSVPPAYGPVPVPPNTLSPVAMSAHVPYTHPHFTSSVTPLPVARPSSRPNFMLGLTIAIAGAVLGSVLGVGVNAKRAAAEVVPSVQAAAAVLDGQSAPSEGLPPARVATARATQAPTANVVARVPEQPPVIVTPSAKVEAPKAKVVAAPPLPVTHKVAAAPVAAPPPAPAAKAPVHVTANPAPVAKPAPAPVAKAAAPVEKPAKAEKAEKAEKNRDADDALKLYKAATDETNLTLGGSK